MDTYSLVMEKIAQKLKAGRKVEEIVKDVIENMNKELNYEIDVRFLHDTFDELNNLRLNAYSYSNKEELKEAFYNTLDEYKIDTSNFILVDALKVLSMSDKLIKIDNKTYCVKIGFILDTLSEYRNAISKYKKISSLSVLLGGIATYRNSDIADCINPRISSLDDAIYLNNNSVSTILAKKLLTDFKYESYNMDFVFYSLEFIGKENINLDLINEEKLDTIFSIRKFLNASIPLKIEDFYKSAQISLMSFYKKYNSLDMIMGYKPKLSKLSVMCSIDIIMECYLDMPKSSMYNKCFTKPIQIKTHFFDTPIYEYRTAENIKLHPIFENEQELKIISRII